MMGTAKIARLAFWLSMMNFCRIEMRHPANEGHDGWLVFISFLFISSLVSAVVVLFSEYRGGSA